MVGLVPQPSGFEGFGAGVVFLDREHLAAAEGVDGREVDLGLQAAALASVSPPLLQDESPVHFDRLSELDRKVFEIL